MNVKVFTAVTPYDLVEGTDVSEENFAPIFKVEEPYAISTMNMEIAGRFETSVFTNISKLHGVKIIIDRKTS